MSSATCQTCRLLWVAMGGEVHDPMDVIAGVVASVATRRGMTTADLVVVVGPRGLGLPFEERAVGSLVMCVISRADLLVWAADDTKRQHLVAAAVEPPPEGRVWILVGASTRKSGLVTLVNHDLPTPTERAALAGELALVPEDGGPAPGRRITKGGVA